MNVNNESVLSVSTEPKKRRRRLLKKLSPIMVVLMVILVIYAISLFVPMFWSLFTSLKSRMEFRTNKFGIPAGWPWAWEWSNYATAFREFTVRVEYGASFRPAYMEEMFLNSILYALGCAAIQSFVCCTVAYLVQRFNWFSSKVIYTVVIVTMVLPIVGSLPSEIQMSQNLHMFGHMWGMWIMKANFLGMYFLVFHAMFKGIPKDFDDAARVDGAGNMTIFLRIILPLVRNTLFTVILINFIGYWNDYQTPRIFIKNYPTIAYGMFNWIFVSNKNSLQTVPMRLTGCIIMMFPILVVFIIFRNRLIGNISMGGLKE